MSEQSGWPRKTLAEVGKLVRGRRFTKRDYADDGLGCIHYADVHTALGATATVPPNFLAEDSRARMRLARPGDLVIAATSENIADVAKAVAWLGDEDVAVHDDCYIFKHELNPSYVSYFFASPQFYAQKLKYVSATKVVRISGSNLGQIKIPIPPQRDQDRIVEIIAAIDNQISTLQNEAKAHNRLRRGRMEQMFAYYSMTGTATQIGTVLEEVKRPITVDPKATYRQIGIRSHGRGLFTKDAVLGESLGSKRMFWLKPGDLVLNIVFAWEGAVAVVPPDVDDHCGSHRFPAYRRLDGGDVEFFRLLFSTTAGKHLLASCSPGGAGRNRTLNRKRLMQSRVGMPAMQEQARAIRELRALQESDQAVRAEADRLGKFRAGMLSGLLDRTIDTKSGNMEV